MNQREATKYIETYLNRNNYSELFKTDPHILLAENRRSNRANRLKYGSIAYKAESNRRISYKLEDIQELCDNKIKPICIDLDKARQAKAIKALESLRLPYAD